MYAAIAYNAQYMVKNAREIGPKDLKEKSSNTASNFITFKVALKSLFAPSTPTLG